MTRLYVEMPAFRARAPWLGGDLQTLRNTMLRDRADLSDWPEDRLYFNTRNADRLNGVLHRGEGQELPLVILIHGLTGCEDSAYIRATARHFLIEGYPVFRLNLRGAPPSRQDCRHMYHAGRSEDLALVLGGLRDLGLGVDGFLAVGYSLGANILLKYLSESGSQTPVLRAVSVSAPLDLSTVSRRLEDARNRVYHRWLLDRMKHDWRSGPLDLDLTRMQALDAARSIREFDDRIVAPSNGFTDAEDYYAQTAAGPRLGGIKVPTLLIHGDDDPWIPADIYHRCQIALPTNLQIELARGGGHVGFHGREGRWHDQCASRFFAAS